MKDALDLQKFYPEEISVTEVIQNEKEICIHVSVQSKNCTCPKCGVISEHKHGTYKRKLQDLPILGRTTYLIVNAYEYQCDNSSCDVTTFVENVSGFGFDVDVLLKHEKYKKRFKGMLPYLLGIVDALTHLRTLHLTLHDGERVWKKDALIVSVGNGAYIGGGMKATPFADPFDGLFEVSVVSSISRAKFLRLLPSFIKGEHTGLPEVEYFRTKELLCGMP